MVSGSVSNYLLNVLSIATELICYKGDEKNYWNDLLLHNAKDT